MEAALNAPLLLIRFENVLGFILSGLLCRIILLLLEGGGLQRDIISPKYCLSPLGEGGGMGGCNLSGVFFTASWGGGGYGGM